MSASNVTPLKAWYDAGRWNEYNGIPPSAQSPDAEINAAGNNLRNWARYLAKNSAIVKAILDARVAKGIGNGLRYEPMVRNRRGELLPDLNDAIRRAHARWSEAIDVTGELTRQEVEMLVWRDWDTAGEVFSRRVYRGRTPQRIGYQVQLIPSELVPYASWTAGEMRLGINRDDWGAPLSYYVHPLNTNVATWQLLPPAIEPIEIPADQICHLRRQEELNQTRGVTLLHAIIFRVSDIAEYQESHRRAARATANMFASINREVGYSGDQNPPEGEDNGRLTLNASDLQIIDYLREGESMNFHDPQHPNQNAVDFVNQELRQIASASRVAFSWIAYVFDRAYAAQRTELVHAWEMIKEDQQKFIRDFAKPCLYDEPLRIALLENRLPARQLRQADPETLYDCRVDAPVMPSIDPEADRKTAELDQTNGWDSRQGIIRRFGRDPQHVDLERSQDAFIQQPLPLDTEEPTA